MAIVIAMSRDAPTATSPKARVPVTSTIRVGVIDAGGVGEVRWMLDGGNTIVQGDLDGNGTVDFEIQIAGVQTLNNLDFLL